MVIVRLEEKYWDAMLRPMSAARHCAVRRWCGGQSRPGTVSPWPLVTACPQFTRSQPLYPEISVTNWTRKQVINEYGVLKVIFISFSCIFFASSRNKLDIKKMKIKSGDFCFCDVMHENG